MKRKNDEGFTLIELLVVMIIIGILAAIAIPVFLSQQNKARATTQKNDLIAMVTDVQSILVDGPAVGLTFTSTGSTYRISGTDANNIVFTPVTGNLSPLNSVVPSPSSVYVPASNTFCIQILNSKTSQSWKYDTRTGGAKTPVSGTC